MPLIPAFGKGKQEHTQNDEFKIILNFVESSRIACVISGCVLYNPISLKGKAISNSIKIGALTSLDIEE